MSKCLSFGNDANEQLWKAFTLDKASQNLYVKYTVVNAPINGSEHFTSVAVRDANRAVTYAALSSDTAANDFTPHTFNLNFNLGSVLAAGSVVTVCFQTTGAHPEPWAPCISSITVSTDPIP